MAAPIRTQPVSQGIPSFSLLSTAAIKATVRLAGTFSALGGYAYDRLPPSVRLPILTGLNYVLKTALVVVPLVGVLLPIKITAIALATLAIVGVLVLVGLTLKRGAIDELNTRFQEWVSQGDILNTVFAAAAGADLEHLTEYDTPLLVAISRGHTTVAQALIQAGADINAYCRGGWTVLMRAVMCRNEAIVRTLIRAGVDLNAPSVRGYNTAIRLAIDENHAGIVQALVNAGAEMNDNDRAHATALIQTLQSNPNPATT